MTDPRPPVNDIDQLTAGPSEVGYRVGMGQCGQRPDARRLVGMRDGIQVHAWTAAELSRLISHEEAAQANPPE